MVAFQLWKDFTVNEVVWYGTKEEWDLVSVGEGEWVGYTYILDMNRHKKNLLIKKVVDWRLSIHYNNTCLKSVIIEITSLVCPYSCGGFFYCPSILYHPATIIKSLFCPKHLYDHLTPNLSLYKCPIIL